MRKLATDRLWFVPLPEPLSMPMPDLCLCLRQIYAYAYGMRGERDLGKGDRDCCHWNCWNAIATASYLCCSCWFGTDVQRYRGTQHRRTIFNETQDQQRVEVLHSDRRSFCHSPTVSSFIGFRIRSWRCLERLSTVGNRWPEPHPYLLVVLAPMLFPSQTICPWRMSGPAYFACR